MNVYLIFIISGLGIAGGVYFYIKYLKNKIQDQEKKINDLTIAMENAVASKEVLKTYNEKVKTIKKKAKEEEKKTDEEFVDDFNSHFSN